MSEEAAQATEDAAKTRPAAEKTRRAGDRHRRLARQDPDQRRRRGAPGRCPDPAMTRAADDRSGQGHSPRACTYDVVSMGYPGPVIHNRPLIEPANLGPGWVGFDFAAALRQAGQGRQRRADAGDRQLRRRPHAVPRPGHRPRRGDDRRQRRPADGACAPSLSQGQQLRRLCRRARPREARAEEVAARRVRRRRAGCGRRCSPTTS